LNSQELNRANSGREFNVSHVLRNYRGAREDIVCAIRACMSSATCGNCGKTSN
jgi:hypothetical protein